MVHLTDEHQRALGLLARRPNGRAEADMQAHGFTFDLLADLVQSGLATAQPQDTRRGRNSVTVTWMTITDAGRAASRNEQLADAPANSHRPRSGRWRRVAGRIRRRLCYRLWRLKGRIARRIAHRLVWRITLGRLRRIMQWLRGRHFPVA
jgi:hypothetical protein